MEEQAMKTFFILTVAVSFVYGWVLVIDQDRLWKWHEKRARAAGFSTDLLRRTPEWEISNKRAGFLFWGLGVITLLLALIM